MNSSSAALPGPDSLDSTRQTGSGLLDSPGITMEGQVTRRAVKNSQQALMISSALENDGLKRDEKAALVEEEYNGQAPWPPNKLKAAKQDWRFNISTQAMMALIDRRTPSLVRAVESSSYLTNAALPDSYPDAVSKTMKYRKRITKVIRSWPGWREFLNMAAKENVLQGYCAAGWRSRYDWRVECIKQGDFRVQDGTTLKAEDCEVFIWKSWWKPSKLLDRILNPEAAAVGWNVDNCVQAINEARPKQKANGAESTGKAMLDLADMQREGVMAMNYANGEVGVDCRDCKFREIDGRVTQYIIRTSDGLELYKAEDIYESMGYAVQFISIEEGNNALYGARGVGRKIYNITRATEKARNIFLDFVGLSGYQWMQVDPNETGNKKSKEAQIQVSAPMVIVNIKGTVIDRPVQVNVQAFVQANQMLTMLAENVAGTVLPTQQLTPTADEKTATQAKIEAGREEELKASVLERWVLQISDIVSIIQQRLVDPDTDDEVAKKFVKELKEIDKLSDEEIFQISKQPAAQSVYNASMILRGQLEEIAQKWSTTGAINMRKLVKLDVEASLDEAVAKEILTGELDDEDILMEGARMQMLEFTSMLDGFDIPVNERDSHLGHLKGAEQVIGAKMQMLTPETIDKDMALAVQRLLIHCQGHIDGLKEQGAPDDIIAKYSGMVKEGGAMLQKVIDTRMQMMQQIDQKAQMLGAAAEIESTGIIPPPPGAPQMEMSPEQMGQPPIESLPPTQ